VEHAELEKEKQYKDFTDETGIKVIPFGISSASEMGSKAKALLKLLSALVKRQEKALDITLSSHSSSSFDFSVRRSTLSFSPFSMLEKMSFLIEGCRAAME